MVNQTSHCQTKFSEDYLKSGKGKERHKANSLYREEKQNVNLIAINQNIYQHIRHAHCSVMLGIVSLSFFSWIYSHKRNEVPNKWQCSTCQEQRTEKNSVNWHINRTEGQSP